MNASNWPDGVIEYENALAAGWTPSPFRQFVFKVFTRCNLACDYCYVYEGADQSWLSKPKLMSAEVIRNAALRINRHARTHGLTDVHLVLHGGEPFLAGAHFFRSFVKIVRSVLTDIDVHISVQTNGTLLKREMAELCRDLDIHVGISLDGNKVANDRHRLLRNGSSTYEGAVSAIKLMDEDAFRPYFSGLLSVVDLDNDPIATYEHLISFAPQSIDFLLPHGTWDEPPPRKSDPLDFNHHPYADWMIRIFDRWFHAPVRETSVRFFEEIATMLLGGQGGTEMIGLAPVDVLVIESDGSLEQVDTLKVAFDGAPQTGLNVMDHDLDQALRAPAVIARQIGRGAMCNVCSTCPQRDVCGAGHYPHRYRSGSGFLNPSVYCSDLYTLVSHIRSRLEQRLQVRPVKPTDLAIVSNDDASVSVDR